MKAETKYFGEVEVAEDQFIHFHNGLPGFEHLRVFTLLPVDEQGLYFTLQSMEEAEVALIVTNPYLFYSDYEFDIDEKSTGDLSLEQPEDVAVYSVVTVKEPFARSTINLQGPVVVNTTSSKGKQIILNKTHYETKHPLFNEKGGGVHARP
ncbi:flagellar assembly protein FliW [Halobacillus massiliensis]|uniref:flagellar assembly protein FliW n=1 Tax=Halobacillus massiliensis TaxID=1926286 RepID=UPI0009E402E6|nr:flagellar assembly protein FliW [Halobacillus massiliensis]